MAGNRICRWPHYWAAKKLFWPNFLVAQCLIDKGNVRTEAVKFIFDSTLFTWLISSLASSDVNKRKQCPNSKVSSKRQECFQIKKLVIIIFWPDWKRFDAYGHERKSFHCATWVLSNFPFYDLGEHFWLVSHFKTIILYQDRFVCYELSYPDLFATVTWNENYYWSWWKRAGVFKWTSPPI